MSNNCQTTAKQVTEYDIKLNINIILSAIVKQVTEYDIKLNINIILSAIVKQLSNNCQTSYRIWYQIKY